MANKTAFLSAVYTQLGREGGFDAFTAELNKRIDADATLGPLVAGIDFAAIAPLEAKYLQALAGGPNHYSGPNVKAAIAELGAEDHHVDHAIQLFIATLETYGIQRRAALSMVKRLTLLKPGEEGDDPVPSVAEEPEPEASTSAESADQPAPEAPEAAGKVDDLIQEAEALLDEVGDVGGSNEVVAEDTATKNLAQKGEQKNMSLFETIGGAPAVKVVVDDFYNRILADPFLAPVFANTDMKKQRQHQAKFIAMALGGPNEYTGKDMRAAHAGLPIGEEHFGKVAGHLSDALKAAGVPDAEHDQIIGAVASLKDDVLAETNPPTSGNQGSTGKDTTMSDKSILESVGGLRSMLDSAPVNIMFSDLEFNLVYMNKASEATLREIEHLLPDKVDNLVGQKIDIFHENPAHQRKLLSNPNNLPHKANIKVGEHTLALTVEAVRNTAGDYVGTMVAWEVITKQLELENQAARIQSMVDTAPVNILLADLDFNLIYMNESSKNTLREIEHLLPDKVDNLLGQSIDIFHKDPAMQRKLLSNPKNLPHKANIQLGEHTLALTVEAVRNANGDYIGPMVAWEVVTERLRLENEAARIMSMVEATPINIMLADLDFNLVYMNKESKKTLKTIEHLLPDRVENLIGQSIDIYHKDPSMQRKLLKNPANLPHKANIQVGDQILALTVEAVRDASGEYIGPMVAWEVVTQQEKTKSTLTDTSVNLDTSSNQLNEISGALAAASEETSAQAQQVAAASEQVNANMETVASSSEEMATTIKEIASNASEAAQVAGEAVREAAGASDTVNRLGDSSNEIGKVIKAITSIAQQTNLLALNATIEAARAGEAGKGFAVVANEVKELAKQTAAATEEITQKIETIQADTGDAVEAIEKISGVIKRIDEISNSIAAAVEEQAATTNEITRNVSQASEGSRSIAENIANVAQAANEASSNAQQVSAASSDLANIVTGLKSLLRDLS